MILAGTGHRLDKLALPGHSGYSDFVRDRLVDLAEAVLRKLGPDKVYSGMALGWDMALAEAAWRCDLPWVAAVPFVGQEGRWPEKSRQHYEWLLGKANDVVVVCPGEYAAWKMQRRNEYMVDNSNLLLALWNGSPGGTGNCIAYAKHKRIEILNVWSSWEKYALAA